MSPFASIAGCVVATELAIFGSSVAFTYSRPASASLVAVPSFAITGALNTGGEFASPAGPLAGALLVKPSDIPLGPQKGDLVVISGAPSPMKSGTYRVQEIFMDAAAGWANLALRFVS